MGRERLFITGDGGQREKGRGRGPAASRPSAPAPSGGETRARRWPEEACAGRPLCALAPAQRRRSRGALPQARPGVPPFPHPSEIPPVVPAGPRQPARPHRGSHGAGTGPPGRVCRAVPETGAAGLRALLSCGAAAAGRLLSSGSFPWPWGARGACWAVTPAGFPVPWDSGLPGRCAPVLSWVPGVSSNAANHGRTEQPLKAGGVKEGAGQGCPRAARLWSENDVEIGVL